MATAFQQYARVALGFMFFPSLLNDDRTEDVHVQRLGHDAAWTLRAAPEANVRHAEGLAARAAPAADAHGGGAGRGGRHPTVDAPQPAEPPAALCADS